MQDIKFAPQEIWIEAFWTCLQDIFQLFETMCYQFPCKESALFTTQTLFWLLFERILTTLLAGVLRRWFLCNPIKIWRLCSLKLCSGIFHTLTFRNQRHGLVYGGYGFGHGAGDDCGYYGNGNGYHGNGYGHHWRGCNWDGHGYHPIANLVTRPIHHRLPVHVSTHVHHGHHGYNHGGHHRVLHRHIHHAPERPRVYHVLHNGHHGHHGVATHYGHHWQNARTWLMLIVHNDWIEFW